MTATFNEKRGGYNIKISHRKENHFYKQITAVVFNRATGGAFDCVTLRLYATDNRHYACVWVHNNCAWIKDGETIAATDCNGSGYAGGWGYHRASAAAGEAIYKAGFDLSEDINGRGNQAIEEAARAIAESIYTDREQFSVYITTAHG
jgi:hypothetical protein